MYQWLLVFIFMGLSTLNARGDTVCAELAAEKTTHPLLKTCYEDPGKSRDWDDQDFNGLISDYTSIVQSHSDVPAIVTAMEDALITLMEVYELNGFEFSGAVNSFALYANNACETLSPELKGHCFTTSAGLVNRFLHFIPFDFDPIFSLSIAELLEDQDSLPSNHLDWVEQFFQRMDELSYCHLHYRLSMLHRCDLQQG